MKEFLKRFMSETLGVLDPLKSFTLGSLYIF